MSNFIRARDLIGDKKPQRIKLKSLSRHPRRYSDLKSDLPWALIIGGGVAALGLLLFVGKKIMDLKNNSEWAKYVFDLTGAIPGLSVKSRLIITAHAAYESGFGQKGNAVLHGTNNLFNIVSGSQWKGAKVVVPNADLSYDPAYCLKMGKPMTVPTANGAACRIDQVWRSYPSYAASIADYWDFLGPNQNGGRYVAARAALVNSDLVTFVQKLGEAGYYDKKLLLNGAYLTGLSAKFSAVAGFVGVDA